MKYDMVKYERGQIWHIHFRKDTAVGREQQKSRPWLILSIGTYNSSCGMITAVPITSQEKRMTPAHVNFKNSRGDDNVILCEQIRSFDTNSPDYMLEFMGVVSQDILESVDVALSIHLGLHYSPITLRKLHESVESVVKSIGYMEQKNNTPKFTDDDVLNFAIKLQEVAQMNTTDEDDTNIESNSIIEAAATQEVVEDVSEEEEVAPEEIIEDTEPQKKTRISWTPEKVDEFLEDTESMPMRKVMEKWNILKKTRYYSTKNYVMNLKMKMS